MKKTLQQIDLYDFLGAIWKRRYVCFLIVSGLTLGAILYSFTLPNIYTSEAVILPVSSSPSPPNGLTTILSSVAGLGGSGSSEAGKSYLIFLSSQVFRSRVVQSAELSKYFFSSPTPASMADQQILNAAIGKLSGMVNVKTDRNFQEKIDISVEAEDPQLANKVVHQYLVELQNFMSRNALTQAKRYRIFLEEQLAKNKEELLEMGKEMSQFYQHNPVSAVNAKLHVPVAMKTDSGTRDFKNYEEFRNYFNSLQQSVNSKEVKPDGKNNEAVQYVRDVPHQVYLQYMQTQQSILEGNYVMLSQAYETAKLEEAKQDPSFIVLDEPAVPQFRSKPNRKSIAIGAFAFSLVIALAYSLLREFWNQIPFFGKLKTYVIKEAEVVF